MLENGVLKEVSFSNKEHKEIYWHTSAHILAAAIKRLYPNAKIAIGPAIENGFYYDFDNLKITEENLKRIEEEMKKIIKEDLPMKKEVISREKAKEMFKDEPYKLELLKDIPENEEISIYWLGNEFVDLCRGPHLASTGMVKEIKLLKLAGAYWRGLAKNKMLTRIYGISFPTKDEMKNYLTFLEEAKKRDHKVLGKRLDLFSFSEYAPGFPFFHDKGVIMLDELVKYWTELHRAVGYEIVRTPQIMKRELWEISGHWEKYKENMYTLEIEGEEYAIKPMNCPGGMLLYKRKVHSYKEFPLKVGELGIVHRHELSGTLNGLFRVRVFTQDDAHIFMTEEQITDQIKEIFDLLKKIYSTFGLEYRVTLSTRPEKYIGTEEIWEKTTNSLKEALESMGYKYEVREGEGAFYGPKIDVLIKDSLGREHQCATIQLDMNLPERFKLTYIGKDNREHRPIMLHRVIYGSLERFLGIIVEHFAGKFPLWINPRQIAIIPVASAFNDYAKEVYNKLEKEGFRVELDDGDETLGKKIRNAQKLYFNYILVLGDKEKSSSTISIRTREGKQINNIPLEEFVNKIKVEKEERALVSPYKE